MSSSQRSLRLGERLGGLLLDPYRFDVDEFPQSADAQLATVARPLHSSERQAWVGSNHSVYKYHSGLELCDEPAALATIIRPRAGSETKGRVVGDLDRMVNVTGSKEEGYRPEDFIAVRRRVLRYSGQHSGSEIVPRSFQSMTSSEQARAAAHRTFDLLGERLDLGLVCQGTDIGRGIQR